MGDGDPQVREALELVAVGQDPGSEERLDDEPESSWLLRLKLRLLSFFVPEDLL